MAEVRIQPVTRIHYVVVDVGFAAPALLIHWLRRHCGFAYVLEVFK